MTTEENLKDNQDFVNALHEFVINQMFTTQKGSESHVIWNKKLGEGQAFGVCSIYQEIPKDFVRIGTVGYLPLEAHGVNARPFIRDDGSIVYEIDDGQGRLMDSSPPKYQESINTNAAFYKQKYPKFMKKFRRYWFDSSIVEYSEMKKYLLDRSIDEHWFTQMIKIANHEYKNNPRGVEDVRAGF